MSSEHGPLVARLQTRLAAEAQAGGWGYYSGKSSRIEPTCWSLLALGDAWDPALGDWPTFSRPHFAFLLAKQSADGLLIDTEPALANFTADGLAALTMTRFSSLVQREGLARLIDGLVQSKGVSIDAPDPVQDNTLQGWPWIRDTFSWAEPTAWCLLALKCAPADKRNGASAARITEAERLLINRSCRAGGWNYGNSSALGQELRAYVPTTAIGLLAMQDRHDDAAIPRALRFLEDSRVNERTTSALALAALSLRINGRPADDVEQKLAEVVSTSERLGNLQAIAMAAYALSAYRHDAEALRVRK